MVRHNYSQKKQLRNSETQPATLCIRAVNTQRMQCVVVIKIVPKFEKKVIRSVERTFVARRGARFFRTLRSSR